MPEDLFAIAYKTELASSRRLAKMNGLSETAALLQTLETAAGNRPLSELIATRKQEQANAATKIAARKQVKADARAHKIASTQPDPDAWLAWFDGATHPNPGKMGIGGLLKSPDGNTTNISFAAGQGDSSEAEYIALIAVLEAAVRAKPEKLVIHGDSQVVINDVKAANGCGAGALTRHREQARQLLAQLNDVTLIWIPRKKNAVADALSQQAVGSLAAPSGGRHS